MIYLDLRPGVSWSLLLKAIAETSTDALTRLREQSPAQGRLNPPELIRILDESCRKPTVDEFIVGLQSSCARLKPLSNAEALAAAPRLEESTRTLLAVCGTESIDPFEFSSYISLALLFGRNAGGWKLLMPGIGTSTSKQALSILANTIVNLSPAARPISPFFAAFLKSYFAPFAPATGGKRFIGTMAWADPLDRESSVSAFRCEESANNADEVVAVTANIDDLSPEILAQAMRVILENGALDYTIAPVTMKKGRPGFQVEVLARCEDQDKIEELLLRHTSTFGVRSVRMARRILERTTEEFASSYGRFRVKKGYYGGECLRIVPEYEDLAALSVKTGVPLVRLYADVMAEIARQSS